MVSHRRFRAPQKLLCVWSMCSWSCCPNHSDLDYVMRYWSNWVEPCTLQDPPEYFTHPVGFLTYKPNLTAAMLMGAVPKNRTGLLGLDQVQGHFRLVNAQLTEVGHVSCRVGVCLSLSSNMAAQNGGDVRCIEVAVNTCGGKCNFPLQTRSPHGAQQRSRHACSMQLK